MSSRAESKTTSFSSLTLRLKGKLQLQRLRHSERVKLTQREEEHTHTLQSECELDVQQRAVLSSLHYFKALVDRLGVDRPGVDRLVQDQSVVGRLLGRASNRVLEAVETLVQESQLHNSRDMSSCLDHLYQSVAQLVHWVDQVILQGVAHDDKESTASVITVIRGLLDAIKELERLAGSAPSSPVQSQPPVEQTGQTEDRGTSCPVEDEWRTEQTEDEPTVCAPPKPAMPRLQAPPPEGLSPPALPPKKRHSLPGPALCRVAIVAPMRREPESLTQEQEDCDDDCLKQCSSSSADSDVDNTHCDDPDYDFLHTDLSSSETLPPLPPSSLLPPALPEKRRRSSAGTTMSQTPTSFDFDSAPKNQDPAPCDDVTDSLDPVSSPLSPCKSPPPLPEKKRHIHQYLQLLSSYNAESTTMFYQTPPTLSHSNRHRETDSAHLGSGHAPSPELLPAPALPPKKKQQDSAEDDTHTENESGDSLQQEEVLLTNQKEILHRITMKSEEEEGPDVKAASPEILMVYALDPELDLFQEAFLSTYRTFISPCDVITKLQHRYRNLREDRDAAKRTFSLLVRVVDELCVMELDSDLLLLLVELVFSLLIGGELKRAYLLRSNVLTKMEQKWRLTGSPGSLRPLAAKGVAARPGTLLDFRSQDLAEQLTLMDSDLFYKIELPEVLLWSKEQNEEKSPNLTEFTQHFNNVSFWVRSVIILQDKPQDRERLLLKFLKIMKHLRKLNNFNSYLSILSALDSAPLRRLDWQRSTSEALEEYSSLIDSSSSFKAYRAALSEVEPPCIPYLGLILQDLTFVHLGNSDSLMTSQGSKVNFSKRWQQFNILYTLKSYQQVPYSLQPNDDIIHFFNDFSDHLAEEALWELSLRIRPRNVPRTNQR